MPRSPALHALVLGLLELGCGGGDDDSQAHAPSGLAGMYQTTITSTSSPCNAAAAPDSNDPAYFQIKDDQDFGEAYIAVYPCTGSDPGSCEEFPDIDFATAASDGTFDSEESSITTDGSPAPSSCSGDYSTAVITKTTGGVTLDTTSHTGSLTGADLCKVNQQFTAQQEAAIKALPCTSQKTVEAQRL